MVAPEVAALALNATLFMTLARRAELGRKPPVRAERHETHRLLPPVAPQDLAHRTRQVVVAQQPEHAAEVGERQLVRFQECLLRRVPVGAVERSPARHRAHRKHLQLGPLVPKIRPRLIPVHLRLLAPGVALRHKRLAQHQAHLPLALAHVVAHRRLSDRSARELPQDPTVDAPRRVPLLARRTPVLVQHRINERHDAVQLRLDPLRVNVRRRPGDRLPHHPAMHPELGRNPRDRPDPKLMLPTELLEQLHSGVPIHSELPGKAEDTLGLRDGSWAKIRQHY